MLLIGSRALAMYYPAYTKDRNIIDWDFICTKNEFKELVSNLIQVGNRLVKISFEEGTNKAFACFLNKETNEAEIIEVSLVDVEGGLQESDIEVYNFHNHQIHQSFAIMGFNVHTLVASINLLYVLKLSHKYKKNSVHFEKTMQDIEFLSKKKLIIEPLKGLLENRERLTYNYGHPKLNTSKKEFFTDSVPYQYDHDTIHEAVKHLDHPAYTYYMKDGEQVLCSKEKFFALPEIVRLYGVLEPLRALQS